MSGPRRIERVGDLLRDEICNIILTSMRDPRTDLVAVTAVEVSGDLQHAKVYVSSANPQADMEDVVRVLTRARGFIRTELRRRQLDLRHLPELTFLHDRSSEHGNRIEHLLRNLDPGPGAAGGDLDSGAGQEG